MLKKCFLILLLPLLAFSAAHKFYVSVTNISYAEKDQALQITSRIFIDDLEEVLKARYELDAHLNTDKEAQTTSTYLEKYMKAKLVFRINDSLQPFHYIGKKYDNDVVIFYLELPDITLENLDSIQIENELLTDLFDDQQNVVHMKINGTKKSFVFMKENTKGVLNF